MAKEKERVIVASAVKEVIKNSELRSGDEFIEALNDKVHEIIETAKERCKGNGRATLRAEDL